MAINGRHDFYIGLQALAESAFPKRCRNCGVVYDDAAEFIAATQPLAPDKSGLKRGTDDDGRALVELFRNCVCGSTLMDCFNDRRDSSEDGARRRQHFNDLIGYLADQGIEQGLARQELLKVMRGESSALLTNIAGSTDG